MVQKAVETSPVEFANDEVRSIGTGILLHHGGDEYVVTALHVARRCASEPLIDMHGGWIASSWQIIGEDEEADIAVLQRVGETDSEVGKLDARYGREGVFHGSISYAMGFPSVIPPIEWDRIEGSWRPIPAVVLTVMSLSLRDSHCVGGYLNYGFSGGPIVAWSGFYPTIVGVITEKAIIDEYTGEHAGLMRITDISLVERIIASHKNQTIDKFRESKLPLVRSNQNRLPFPPSLCTGEILDAVVRLGKVKSEVNR